MICEENGEQTLTHKSLHLLNIRMQWAAGERRGNTLVLCQSHCSSHVVPSVSLLLLKKLLLPGDS